MGRFWPDERNPCNEHQLLAAQWWVQNRWWFSVWTDLGYKASFDTAVGKITINSYVKYRPVQRTSEYNKHNENKRVITEVNELRAGLSVSLSTK